MRWGAALLAPFFVDNGSLEGVVRRQFASIKGGRMAKTPKRHNENWTKQEVKQLKQLVKENTSTRVIGIKLERSEASIYGKA